VYLLPFGYVRTDKRQLFLYILPPRVFIVDGIFYVLSIPYRTALDAAF
jgi:hypothetical protein